jgi:hypothetical protein
MKYGELVNAIGLIVLFVLLAIISPILTIWAWNTLFGAYVAVELTWKTWCAVILLSAFFKTTIQRKKAE